MPNNCSTLIQRKQNILHKVLRSNSESKLQNAIAETTAELRVSGTRKTPAYSTSANHLTTNSIAAPATRRSGLFTASRVHPSTDHNYATHLPSIRDAAGHVDRHHQLQDDIHSYPRSKTPIAGISPKGPGRPPSAPISSLFHTLAKRSTENLMSSNGELDETIVASPVPPSRRSQRPSNGTSKYVGSTNQINGKQTTLYQKQSGDSGVDIRYSTTSADTNQQQRALTLSARLRSTVPNVQVETPVVHETVTRERTNIGQLYQRRPNNTIKAPIKQKIDKYRRRSEEVTQATNGNTLMNAANTGLSATTPALSSARPRPPPSPSSMRRVTSDGEIQARLEVLRLSMDTNLGQVEQQNSHYRIKSPYLYNTHQQLAPPATPQTPPTILRRTHGVTQAMSSATPSQQRQTNGINYRRQHQSTNTGQGNLYLAFIASRHLSTLEDTLHECDIDHPKLLRIFTWLKNIEEHRHEQSDHDKLIIEQNQRMIEQEDNLSLYSEIQYAVDELPPNTTGKPCEKIATMQFDD